MRSWALVAFALWACRDAAGPDPYFPPGAVALDPPPAVYAQWWREVEACAAREGRFDAVRFYVVPGSHGWPDGDEFVLGAWARDGNRITVGELSKLDAELVRHEMLHALLQRGDHPAEYFVTRCGALVGAADAAP